ncbi:calpastatin isoform X3 [Centropristis striata]|uniref:calpastatin isoform X3 n=1 Tax=Centropristis striata TaxID=184440 RepID=UPI0027DF3CF4|nr:calpastatin isoform X3 [Centropristis striata]
MAYAAFWDSTHGGASPSPPEVHHGGKFLCYYPTPSSCYGKSQPGQATPKPAAQVSTVKPAQFEKASSGSAMATKPGVVSTATGPTGSRVTAGGSASVGTAGKTKAETAPVSQVKATATVPSPAAGTTAAAGVKTTGVTAAGITATGYKAAGTAAAGVTAAGVKVAGVTAAGVTATTAVTRPKESPQGTAKSAIAVETVKADVLKVDPVKTSKPTAAVTAPTQTKVQVEVPPAAAKGAKEVDPLDALASILPSVDPVTPPQPEYTGPEVQEHDIIVEVGQKCGERDSTLPPGYRFEDMPPAPADVKPKDVPKPLSTDEALDSLLSGFTSPSVPAAPEKKDYVDSVSASSAGPANFAPPSVKTPQTPAAVPPMAAPPADKKARTEKVSDDFSLEDLLPSATAATTKAAPPVAVCPAPPTDKKATKPTTDVGGALMSQDVLSDLNDLLPKDQPKPELPKPRPEDIVSEPKHTTEEGVLVGEREDSIPPEYRPNKAELEKQPAPKPEPTIGTGEALDFLSEGFMTSSSAPAVKAPPAQKVPPADKKSKTEKVPDDFSLEAGLTSSTAKKVESAVPPVAVCTFPPADKKVEKTAAAKDATDGKLKAGQVDPMSLDALSDLSDLLPKDEPKPELPELRPEDIVSEDKHDKEKGVLVGEREDSIAPKYRFNKAELEKLPAPKPEPTIGTGEALDFLSEGFMTSSSAPAVQAPVVTPSAPPAQTKVEDLSALDTLSADFVAPAKASGVHTPAPPTTKKTSQKTVCPLEQPNTVDVLPGQPRQSQAKTDEVDPMSLDVLSALSDTLPEDKPKPALPELRPEDIVSEDKHDKEKGVLVGEREDSIAPKYRFNKAELEKLPAPKPEPTIGTGEALDFLSEGFMTSSSAPAVQAPVVTPSAPPAQPSADFALDALAGDFVSSTAAPTVKSAACVPAEPTPELAAGADNALDVLSDTLMDITPAPQPAPVPTKDIVKEKKVVEEKLIKMGERDDTLPPEYRLTEEDLKKMAEAKAEAAAKPKETMDDKTALDLLSGDFMSASEPAAPVAPSAATTKLEPPVLDSEPLKPMAGPVLDSLSSTLLPDAPEFKPKTDKPKKHHAEEPAATEQLPAQPSSDVVPKSAKKGGRT